MPITDEGGEETKIPMEQLYTDDYDQYTEGKILKSFVFAVPRCLIKINTDIPKTY